MTRAAWAEIDLDALRHNLNRVRQLAGASRVMAVVKADAYGHGLIRVAKTLSDADAYAVASLDEALRLRDAGIDKPIVLLAGFLNQEELEVCAAQSLEPVIHDGDQLALLEQAGEVDPLTLWLKIDTGMHRLGFAADQFDGVVARLEACGSVESIRYLTHLANADDLADPLTALQVERMQQAVARREDAVVSIANSGGILGWEQSHQDWVRPGIMLYGATPFAAGSGKGLDLRPVMSFKARLIAIKQLSTGDRVGYSGTFTADRDMTMGVVGAGYGDGYPRHVEEGTVVRIRDCEAPIIGRVSMDLICIDLSGVASACLGDEVLLWGPELPVESIARHAGTIAYELTCQVTSRVRIKEI